VPYAKEEQYIENSYRAIKQRYDGTRVMHEMKNGIAGGGGWQGRRAVHKH
jgi:hypothetical protein